MNANIGTCTSCKKDPIFNKRRGLCQKCYGKYYRAVRLGRRVPEALTELELVHDGAASREMDFIKNFFKHNEWIHSPATFRLGTANYTPDFYDQDRDVFIEVIGSRQAFSQNRVKYLLMRQHYPKLKFELRNYLGELVELPDSRDVRASLGLPVIHSVCAGN